MSLLILYGFVELDNIRRNFMSNASRKKKKKKLKTLFGVNISGNEIMKKIMEVF